MQEFKEEMRYIYDLTPDSLVMDVGAHKGTFAAEIFRKYNCRVACYEPVAEFFSICAARFAGKEKISVLNYGLGNRSRLEEFHIKGDMTGRFAEGPTEQVAIKDIHEEMPRLGLPLVDLLKINIEGGEYELLGEICAANMAEDFRDIQVQFHGCIPNAAERREEIRAVLAYTHHLTYDCPFIWENWRRNA